MAMLETEQENDVAVGTTTVTVAGPVIFTLGRALQGLRREPTLTVMSRSDTAPFAVVGSITGAGRIVCNLADGDEYTYELVTRGASCSVAATDV